MRQHPQTLLGVSGHDLNIFASLAERLPQGIVISDTRPVLSSIHRFCSFIWQIFEAFTESMLNAEVYIKWSASNRQCFVLSFNGSLLGNATFCQGLMTATFATAQADWPPARLVPCTIHTFFVSLCFRQSKQRYHSQSDLLYRRSDHH